MKQYTKFLFLCLLAACGKDNTKPEGNTSRVTVIYDITDTLASKPLPDPILAQYGFENSQDIEAYFRLVLITDKRLNPVEVVHLDDGQTSERKNTNEETEYREQLVTSFFEEVRKTIANCQPVNIPVRSLKHSECFSTIAAELELLSKSLAFQRKLIVFSDLQENTVEFSCYANQGQYLLEHSPETVARLLLKRHPLPEDMEGVVLYLVFNPRNMDEDARFLQMAAVYQRLLVPRHVQIVIQATNKYFEP